MNKETNQESINQEDIIFMKKAEAIADEARNHISRFCFEDCGAYCCRKGYLIILKDQIDTVTQGRKEELEKKGILKKLDDNKYSLFMSNYDCPCPSLKDFKCLIHKSDKRPKVCGEFPIFLDGKYLKLSPRCLAVKQNLLYPYVKELLAMGFKLLEADPYADMELYKVDFSKDKQD